MCKECGSDHDTGWAQHADHYGQITPDPIDPPRASSRAFMVIAAVLALLGFGGFLAFFLVGIRALLVTGAVSAIAVLAWRRWRKSPPARTQSASKELLIRVRGDAELAERLIVHELQRRPGMTREQAMQLAMTRLEHDRR